MINITSQPVLVEMLQLNVGLKPHVDVKLAFLYQNVFFQLAQAHTWYKKYCPMVCDIIYRSCSLLLT